ncbi:glycosyltransferase AglG [Arthrobacter sp. Hiyo8]|nr:glycosyltransferase AglG [Arthrobacter sp. Hiyo8]
MPAGAGRPSISVVICCFTEARWELLLSGIASVRAQTFRPEQLVVVVDHNTDLYRRLSLYGRLTGALTGVETVENSGPPGLSGARNTGVAAATGDIVAFLDDDAEAAPDWLARLVLMYEDPDVLAVGAGLNPCGNRVVRRTSLKSLIGLSGAPIRDCPESRRRCVT